MRPFTFRMLGVPVTVQPGFLLFIGVIALTNLPAGTVVDVAMYCFVITVSLLVHEFGHALVARALGVEVYGIELAFMHGTASHQRTTPARQLAISLSGPGAGFLLAVAALAGLTAFGALGVTAPLDLLSQVLLVNVVYGVFNLLPILPLDGGNALRSAVAWASNARTAVLVSSGVGVLTAGALLVYGLSVGMMLITALAGWMMWINLQSLQQARQTR